jgi:hypothetical protein
VLRHLVLKLHPALVDPIIAHATGVVAEDESVEGEVVETVAAGTEE